MQDFGAVVVGELCDAIADFVDADPKAAAKVARKLGSTLRARQQREDDCHDLAHAVVGDALKPRSSGS
jgi:hypothetical protein